MEILRSKIDNFTKIHTIPPVLAALLAELENDTSATASVARIINNDVSLTARLLRAANSAFYKRQFEISTVEKAVSVLGTKAVRALALSVSLFDITNSAHLPELIDFKEFWQHNLEVAIISQKLAGEVKCCQPEEAFVCGLLHDLGLLFFIQECHDEYSGVLKKMNTGQELEAAEKEALGTSHSEVGTIIASIWRLPGVICESIANHHHADLKAFAVSDIEIWHLVNLAHRLCHQGLDVSSDQSPDEIKTRNQLAETIGIDSQTLIRLVSEVPEMIIQTASFLDIDIGDPMTLLQKANTELGNLYELYEKAKIENDDLQAKLLIKEKKEIILDVLSTTLATLSHYVNNANAAIVGRAQILELYLDQGRLNDPEGKIAESIKIISESVDVISAVLDELKELPEYKTVKYHDHSRILDIDKNIKARLGRLA